jgi:hypothetical protein
VILMLVGAVIEILNPHEISVPHSVSQGDAFRVCPIQPRPSEWGCGLRAGFPGN